MSWSDIIKLSYLILLLSSLTLVNYTCIIVLLNWPQKSLNLPAFTDAFKKLTFKLIQYTPAQNHLDIHNTKWNRKCGRPTATYNDLRSSHSKFYMDFAVEMFSKVVLTYFCPLSSCGNRLTLFKSSNNKNRLQIYRNRVWHQPSFRSLRRK